MSEQFTYEYNDGQPQPARDVTISRVPFKHFPISDAVLMEECAFYDEGVIFEELKCRPLVFFAAHALRRAYGEIIDPKHLIVDLGHPSESCPPTSTLVGFLIASVDRFEDDTEISSLLTEGVSRLEEDRDAVRYKLIRAWKEEALNQEWAELHVYPTQDGLVDDRYVKQHGFQSFPDVDAPHGILELPAVHWVAPRRGRFML